MTMEILILWQHPSYIMGHVSRGFNRQTKQIPSVFCTAGFLETLALACGATGRYPAAGVKVGGISLALCARLR